MTLSILIVEDELLIALDMKDQLEDAGYQVTEIAADVDGCKASALRDKPDLALMDIRLARNSSGVEAGQWLYRELGVRCIFVSGNLDDETRERLSDVEPIAFLDKPVLMNTLINTVATYAA